jgi:hypothetical protein
MRQADGRGPEEAATSAASATHSIQEDIDEPFEAQQASATREAGYSVLQKRTFNKNKHAGLFSESISA